MWLSNRNIQLLVKIFYAETSDGKNHPKAYAQTNKHKKHRTLFLIAEERGKE